MHVQSPDGHLKDEFYAKFWEPKKVFCWKIMATFCWFVCYDNGKLGKIINLEENGST